MRVYTCEPTWDAMLTTIYEAWTSKLGHENIQLLLEPLGQISMFDEYIHVEADSVKAQKVVDAIYQKISARFYQDMITTSMAYEEDVLDNIYHVMILGFAYGSNVLEMLQFRDVSRNQEIRRRVDREANRFQEIVRFHQLGDVYIAHIEPKSRVVGFLGPIFQDRMPSEYFIIVDDTNLEAVVHPKNEPYYLWKLSKEEHQKLLESEEVNDEYTDLWRVFFETIAIKERKNERCQMGHFPKWARAHAVEFMPHN